MAAKTQTDPIPQRTRRIQTLIVPITKTVSTQCNFIQSCSCTSGEQSNESVINKNSPEVDETEANTEDDCSDMDWDNDCDIGSDFDPDFCDDFEENDSEGDDSEDEYETNNYRLENRSLPGSENYYIVSESSLCKLLSVCRFCNSTFIPIIDYSKGTLISTSSVCSNGHVFSWQSQSCHNKLPWGNLILSSAIMFSGNNTAKILRFLNHMKVQVPSVRTVTRLQSAYTVPATIEEFDSKQVDVIQSLQGNSS